jgi:hypothetical protein
VPADADVDAPAFAFGAKKILVHLGLPSEPLPTARAQAPPVTLELFPEA